MRELLFRLAIEEDGPAAVEYAVILALIVAVCISGVRMFGLATASSFDTSAAEIAAALGT
jgi:pilus assembly protein Flp/PilA